MPQKLRRPIRIKGGCIYKPLDEEICEGGIAELGIQVLKNKHGFYIGTLWYNEEFNHYIPGTILSTDVWDNREDAELALINNNYKKQNEYK